MQIGEPEEVITIIPEEAPLAVPEVPDREPVGEPVGAPA